MVVNRPKKAPITTISALPNVPENKVPENKVPENKVPEER